MYRIGIDVGGTFTDLVAIDDAGASTLAKVPTTPDDPSRGVLDGLTTLATALILDRPALLAATARIVHGTTVATNALLERKGARLGLLTTEGHRDVIEMREGLKDDRYNLRVPPPEQLVPRPRRLGVRERIRSDGRVETPIEAESLEAAIAALKRERVEAVAVCYLHAWRDPAHERETGAALARALPEAYVSLSADVLPQIKEYERVSTTIVNAYVGPVLSRYLARLETRLVEAGYRGPTLIIQSHGGVAPIAEAGRLAAGAVLSGPAGGVAGSVHAARVAGEPNLIPFDMGGTSTDICLVVDGQAALVMDRRVGGHRIALGSLDIASIGAGGGSIARVDAGGILHVGPESAGAAPGPACYGNGGTDPTVTDANLVLGYLDPANFLGGARRLDLAAAERAVDKTAAALGIDRLAAARGIHRIVNTNMAEGVRLVSVRRGVDPRRFALFAFGGAAGLHATDIARQLQLGRVIVPRVAAVLSAWGMLATDLRFEVARSHIGDTSALDGAAVKALYDELETEGRDRLSASFTGEVRASRSADMRYGEQVFEINVPLDDVDWSVPDPLPQITDRFHKRHEALYTYSLPDQDGVLVNARIAVSGILEAPPQEPTLPAGNP
ncbi:MAG TPA: hydantoinase/oxoprolinase family protein, partial [Stellaceae bacterium]|nr:hydantoinase/oxoprolinase family protein [Stellaceae bacterium]